MFLFLSLLLLGLTISLIASPFMAHSALKRVRALELEVALLKNQTNSAPPTPMPEPEESSRSLAQKDQPPEPKVSTSPAPVTHKTGYGSFEKQRPSQEKAAPIQNKFTEQKLASHWLVILGGITVALGSLFLVKHSIDNNLVSPSIRVFLGVLLGVALAIGGEWVRRRPLQVEFAKSHQDFVPAALTGAGVLAMFASVYVGFALYGFFGPILVFGLLAAISISALALSLLQGPLIACLGILGALVLPMLVGQETYSPWGLFSFLSFVSASAMAVVRYKRWWWLAGLAVSGSMVWQLLWMGRFYQQGDVFPLIIHLFVLLVMVFAVHFDILKQGGSDLKHPFELHKLVPEEATAFWSSVGASLLVICLVRSDSYSWMSLGLAGLFIVGLAFSALKLKNFEALLVVACCSSLVLLASWHHPEFVQLPEQFVHMGAVVATFPSPIVPPEFAQFTWVALTISVGFASYGYLGVWRSKQPDMWAVVSVLTPLLSLAICYWRMGDTLTEFGWAGVSMGLAGLAVLSATRIAGVRNQPGKESALGIYALAAIASLTLAGVLVFDKAWLSVGLALQLPTLAWAQNKFHLSYLRPVAFVVAGVVLVRLMFLHYLPGSILSLNLDAGWILYSYGIPALAFGLAARLFIKSNDDHLVMTLEAGAIAISVALASMEIRQFFGDQSLGFENYSLLEQSLHSISWLVSGYGLYRRQRQSARSVQQLAAMILIGLAAGQVLVMQVLLFNPLTTGDQVGAWMFFDKLFLAYLVPALLAGLICREAQLQKHRLASAFAGAIGLALTLLYISLEVRHFFQGENLKFGVMSNAEGYGYSVAWLVYAGILLAIGFLRQHAVLRQISLGLILLVVVKVFLWDMSVLTGLYRAASFLGLGLSLIGIGFLYQRYGNQTPPPA